MKCNPELVSAFLDGELDSIILNHVARHLKACEACRKTLSQLAQVRDALTEHYTLADPEAFTGSIMTAIYNEQTLTGHPPHPVTTRFSASVVHALSMWLRPGDK